MESSTTSVQDVDKPIIEESHQDSLNETSESCSESSSYEDDGTPYESENSYESEFSQADSNADYRPEEPPKRQKVARALSVASSSGSSHLRGLGRRNGYKSVACTFSGCGRTFNRISRLLEHFRTHTKERPFHCTFKDCLKKYARQDHLNRHLRTHGVVPLTYTDSTPTVEKHDCTFPQCDKTYTSAQYLKKHLKSHTDPKNYKCTWEGCDFVTKKRNQLYVHTCRHENILPYPCPIEGCNKRYKAAQKRNEHLLSHSVKGLYLCGYKDCDARFTTSSQLKSHLEENHVAFCTLCDKTFPTMGKLKYHSFTHVRHNLELVDGPDVLRSKCPFESCTSSFFQKKNLYFHIRTVHQGLEFHDCPIKVCQKRFLSKNRLIEHMNKFHSETPPLVEPVSKANSASALKMPDLDSVLGLSQAPNAGAFFSCPFPNCFSRYLTQGLLKTHVASAHKTEASASLENSENLSVASQAIVSRSSNLGSQKTPLELLLDGAPLVFEHPVLDDPGLGPAPDLQFKCPFPGCDKQYKNASSLYRHRKHVHAN